MALNQSEKRQVVELILAGNHCQEATAQVGVKISESTAYRILLTFPSSQGLVMQRDDARAESLGVQEFQRV